MGVVGGGRQTCVELVFAENEVRSSSNSVTLLSRLLLLLLRPALLDVEMCSLGGVGLFLDGEPTPAAEESAGGAGM